MSLSGIPRSDLEFRKFTEVGGEPAVRTTATGTFQQTGLKVLGKTTMLSVDDTAWYAAPATALSGRNNIEIQNPSNATSDLLWVYDNSSGPTVGFHIHPGASRSLSITDSIHVYVRTVSGSTTVVVEELS